MGFERSGAAVVQCRSRFLQLQLMRPERRDFLPGARPVQAEALLAGEPVGEPAFRRAADAALRDARPQSQNGFKVELARRCLVHALKEATR